MGKIIEMPSTIPYVGTEYILVEKRTLPRADRTLTHLERYILKERGRGRVLNVQRITSRFQIGRVER